MTLAVVALFAAGRRRSRNIGSWRVKETDRIAAMATELRKLGATVEEGADWLRVAPPARLAPATIDTYDDHRMAMCFSLAALGGVPVRINDPDCVRKTFPDYFDAFARDRAARRGDATATTAAPPPVIAIDGPAASGKGTVAAGVARGAGLSLPRQRRALPAGRAEGAARGHRARRRSARWRAAAAALDVALRRRRGPARRRRRRPRRSAARRVSAAASQVAVHPGGPRGAARPPAGVPAAARAGRRRPRHGHRRVSRTPRSRSS